VKKFLQISNILLVKIQNESNMTKWAHLAHNAHGGVWAEQDSHECCRLSARAGDRRRPPGPEIIGFGSKFGRIWSKFDRIGR
jgi:hypothetical protein